MIQSPFWCVHSIYCEGPTPLYDSNCKEDQFLSPDTVNKSVYSGEYSEEEVITQCIEEELDEKDMINAIQKDNLKEIISNSSCPKKIERKNRAQLSIELDQFEISFVE